MVTEPGGESSQYESIKTVDKTTETQSGQLGDKETSSSAQLDQEKKGRGDKTAENVRYGQDLSESDVGGKTANIDGTANQGGYGGTAIQEVEEKASKTRIEQGYGPGSGVGA